MRLILALALFAACAARPRGPTAIVRMYEPGEWSHDDIRSVAEGLAAWRQLGFITEVEQETALPACPNDWAARGLIHCALVLGLRKEPCLMSEGMRGASDRVTDTITVDANIHGKELAHVIAHEAGHILLNTSKHVRSYGVMLSGGSMSDLSAQDRALACGAIHRGCK
jgi:Zn-dependent protease with chaperone function